MQAPVLVESRGRFGVLTLNRPEALNALSLPMIRSLNAALRQWKEHDGIEAVVLRSSSERAFCAGGDIRFFHRVATGGLAQGSALLEDFFTEEYQLNHLLHRYPKPVIALMDGVVMGGGMGISQGSTLRVVTERTRMGMPEVSIGLFPDVGGGYFLSRCRGNTGFELALTGRAIQAADALHAGLADVAIAASRLAAVDPLLEDASPDQLMNEVRDWARNAPLAMEAPVQANQEVIERVFAASSMVQVIHALEKTGSPYAEEALQLIRQRSPLMLCVTLEQLRRAATMDVGDCLRMERTMMRRCFEGGEVLEGIRARVIDKDHQPRWQHQRVEDVPQEAVDRFFEPAWPDSAHPLRDLD